LIDHPQVLRELVKQYNAKPSYTGGQKLIDESEITRFLDQYSKDYKRITDPIWEKELKSKCQHWRESSQFK
jgi:hypothetical protein